MIILHLQVYNYLPDTPRVFMSYIVRGLLSTDWKL